MHDAFNNKQVIRLASIHLTDSLRTIVVPGRHHKQSANNHKSSKQHDQ